MFRFQNCRPVWALIIVLALLKSAIADTHTWIGNAHDVRQIDTITIADTWASGDAVTMTINGKDIVVTIGSEATTAQVATAIRNAWNASTRLDGSGSPNATSNAGGQEFGEFSEAVATVTGSVVTITANVPGKPFTLTVTETTAGDGTATEATAQAATGRYFWDNADNWDIGAVPANDDVVRFLHPNLHVRYGLPNGSLEVTFEHYHSANGEIGLPPINLDNPAKPYKEYRQTHVRLDDSGAGTDIAHRIGIGQIGTGTTLINLKHSTVKCSPVIYNTAAPLASRPGTYAVNICCTADTSTLDIHNGWVDYSSQDGSTSAFRTVAQQGGNARGIDAMHSASTTLNANGGNLLIGGSETIINFNVRGGSVTCQNLTGMGASTTVVVYSGLVNYASAATLGVIDLRSGTLDLSLAPSSVAITSFYVYEGARILDPSRRATVSGDWYWYFNPSPDLQLGNAPGTPIKVVYP